MKKPAPLSLSQRTSQVQKRHLKTKLLIGTFLESPNKKRLYNKALSFYLKRQISDALLKFRSLSNIYDGKIVNTSAKPTNPLIQTTPPNPLIQTIRRLLPTNCLSVFGNFVRLTIKGLQALVIDYFRIKFHF